METLIQWGGGVWGGIGLAVLQIAAFLLVLLLGIAATGALLGHRNAERTAS